MESEFVNAPYGYDMSPASPAKQKWYRWPPFPLVPMREYRKGDHHNCSSWFFDWLFFRYWSLDHVEFRFDIAIDVQPCGGSAFRIGAILPYTRLMFSIPLPLGWLWRFRRKPPSDRCP